MEMLRKNLVFIIALVVIVGAGIYWVAYHNTGDSSVDGDAIVERPSQYADVRAEILSIIATLQAVHLDISVLDDPAFRSLTETPRLGINDPLEVGRRNPFAP
jgi:hypothetical protein